MKIAFDDQYLAGVADSDGSFSCGKKYSKARRKNYYVAQFQITWKYSKESKLFFDLLCEKFGGSYFDGSTHNNSFAKTRILKYCATGNACSKICIATLPYLILKKKQAKIVMKGASLKSIHWGTKGKTMKVWMKEEKLYKEMNKLNTKNIKI